MFFYEGFVCPICEESFRENEDIVTCPRCGLPHHRSCWKEEGHCHLEHLHGTADQWSREKAQTAPHQPEPPVNEPVRQPINGQICPRCHTRNPQFAEICTHCGQQLQAEDWYSRQQDAQPPSGAEYTPFYSNIPAQETYSSEEWIGQHQAKELAAVVGQNAAYYVPRFRRVANGQSCGWNWAAFLFGPYWLLFRKQYLLGLVYFFCQTVYSFAYSYLLQPILTATTAAEMQEQLQRILMDEAANFFLLPILVLSLILTIARILLGLRGNHLYKQHCESLIRKARERTPDLSAAELSSVGGTSVAMAAIFYMIPTVISYILALSQAM